MKCAECPAAYEVTTVGYAAPGYICPRNVPFTERRGPTQECAMTAGEARNVAARFKGLWQAFEQVAERLEREEAQV